MTKDERIKAYKIATDPNFALSQTLEKVLGSVQQIKGDKGDTPVKGQDYFTNSEINQIIAYVRSQIRDGVDGRDGFTPIKGEHYFDGAKGKDGYTPQRGQDYYTIDDENNLIKKLLTKIPKPKDGVSPKHDDVAKVVMGNLEKMRKDDHQAIIKEILNNPVLRMLLHGGGSSSGGTTSPLTTKGDIYGFSTVNARVPVGLDTQVLTADSTQVNGVKWATPSAGGVNFVDEEDLTPQGVGTVFNLAFTPIAGSVKLYRGGARQQRGVGKDYTIAAAAITLAVALVSGEILIADYRK